MLIEKINNNLKQEISGPLVLKPDIYTDQRGYFFETWNQRIFNEVFKLNILFVQDNQSYSNYGTLRGLHFQLNPMAQGKLVRVTSGEVCDVLVDLRKNSETFGSWAKVILNSKNKKQIWIPQGFAHGFMTLSEEAIVEYKVTNYWSKKHERTLIWNDKTLSIEWPDLNKINKSPHLSIKDTNGKTFESIFNSKEFF